MHRREFLQMLTLGTMTVPRAASAESRKAYRIGILAPKPTRTGIVFVSFFEALREAGWVERRDIHFELRPTAGDPVRADAAARELAAIPVDVIVTSVHTAAAARATTQIPIVMMTSGYPVEVGLVKSYARPGGNITGNSVYAGRQLFGKHPEILKMLLPRLSRLAVLWSYVPPIAEVGEGELGLTELEQAAASLGIAVRVWKAWRSEDVEAALTAIQRERPDALYVTAFVVQDKLDRVVQFARDQRLPTMTDFAGRVFGAGILMTYSANQLEIGRQTARFVDRILRGARPGDLPIERPSKFDLIINVRTARAIGLTVPSSLLLRADLIE
jgi:putative ABC transport system substrate-binding protein